MMNALIALGLGIVVFALVVGVGVVVLTKFGTTVAQCTNSSFTYIEANQTCSNGTNSYDAAPANSAWTANKTLSGYLSSNLVTWIPAVIALGVGLLFIGSLMGQKAKY